MGDALMALDAFSIDVSELDDVLDALNNVPPDMVKAMEKGVTTTAVKTLGGSQDRSPVDTGFMSASGFVTTRNVQVSAPQAPVGEREDPGRHSQIVDNQRASLPKDPLVFVAVVGHTARYSLFVHEDMTAFHPNGQAKFLEASFNEHTPDMASNIAKAAK